VWAGEMENRKGIFFFVQIINVTGGGGALLEDMLSKKKKKKCAKKTRLHLLITATRFLDFGESKSFSEICFLLKSKIGRIY